MVGHSEGTKVMYHYLAESEKAAEHRASVAPYVNLDGQEKNPGVARSRCGLDAAGTPRAANPNGTWKAPKTSRSRTRRTCRRRPLPQTFQQIFKFFRGKLPKHDIVPQKGKILLAGKALEFPQNTGLAGDTVEVWPVNSNGERATKTPIASIPITDGSRPEARGGRWRPRPGSATNSRSCSRTQDAPRLHGAVRAKRLRHPPARVGAIEKETGKIPGSSGAVMIRYKEYWGNEPGQNDELLVNGLEGLHGETVSLGKEGERVLRVQLGRQGRKHPERRTGLSKLPFIQAAQVYIPGSTPPNAIVSYQLNSRGGGGVRTLNVPNWEGTTNQVEIFWNDFESLNF